MTRKHRDAGVVPLGLVLTGALAAVGCVAQTGGDSGAVVAPSYNAETGRLERIAYDRNRDGTPDAWMYMDGTRPVRAEIDEDHDGSLDRWEYFVDASDGAHTGAAGAVLARVEIAEAGSGPVTRREFYENGRLACVEEDTTGDGLVDTWETWVDGALATKALDLTGRGTPDRRVVYPAGGRAPRLELDVDGTGQFRPAPPAR
jgi:hypothetical protein